ncbi:hypothetical protein RSAG8_11557, partial [Rhizoctonia solani AG-8 WAC10335]
MIKHRATVVRWAHLLAFLLVSLICSRSLFASNPKMLGLVSRNLPDTSACRPHLLYPCIGAAWRECKTKLQYTGIHSFP